MQYGAEESDNSKNKDEPDCFESGNGSLMIDESEAEI